MFLPGTSCIGPGAEATPVCWRHRAETCGTPSRQEATRGAERQAAEPVECRLDGLENPLLAAVASAREAGIELMIREVSSVFGIPAFIIGPRIDHLDPPEIVLPPDDG